MEQTQTSPHGLFANGPHATSSDPPFCCHSRDRSQAMPTYAGTPGGSNARHPSAEDWAAVKAQIHVLYVLQKKPLREVRHMLFVEHNIKASDRMIKSRLKEWGFVKNAKKEDWGLLAVLHERRKKAGKQGTIFNVHGHRKTFKDLQRFIRNQNQTVEQFLAEHQNHSVIPSYIRAWTPGPEDDIRPDSPPSVADPPLEAWSPSPTDPPSSSTPKQHPLLQGPIAERATAIDPSPAQRPRQALARQHKGPYQVDQYDPQSSQSNATHLPPLSRIPERLHPALQSTAAAAVPLPPTQVPTPPVSEPCHQMDAELEACGTQLLKPQRLISKLGQNDLQLWSWIYHKQDSSSEPEVDIFQICSRCKQPSQRHFRSLDNFEPVRDSPNRNLLNDCHNEAWHLPVSTKDEGAWLWVSRCFLACMCFTRGDEKMGTHALKDAAAHFEKLLARRDRLLLTAAVLMTAILHQHDQEDIAFRILESAKEAADRFYEDATHPIRVTMAYFMHSANDSFDRSNISSATMEAAYLRLRTNYHTEHPYVIAARCNYGWMLKYEGKLVPAEEHLKEVRDVSCAVFGQDHMQSIIARSLIAGCIALSKDMRRLDECNALYTDVIDRTGDLLGISHPYRLEAMRRLAENYGHVDDKIPAQLQLLKEVLWGRAKMLGRAHHYTIGSKTAYEDALKLAHRWVDDRSGDPSGERVEIEDLFNRDFQDAWMDVVGDEAQTAHFTPVEVSDEASRKRTRASISRTPSPTKSDDYAAY